MGDGNEKIGNVICVCLISTDNCSHLLFIFVICGFVEIIPYAGDRANRTRYKRYWN